MHLTHPEMLLLETARGRAERRGPAWMERQRLYPLPTFPSPADQLLSLVAAEHKQLDDSEHSRLKGILKFCWVSNQAKLAVARDLGKGFLWLGDLALLMQCYVHAGQRPIGGLEALVSPELLSDASRHLEEKGFMQLGRSADSAFFRCPNSNLSLRLLTRLLPIRRNPSTIPSRSVNGLRVLAPELLAIRQCLARPHNAWWVADLVSLFPRLDPAEMRFWTEEVRSSLAVSLTVQRINRLGLEPIGSNLSKARIYPGEWLEWLLGERGIVAALLPVERWRDLPAAFVRVVRSRWFC